MDQSEGITMLDLSTDKKIRKGQFRSLAKDAMATSRWSRSDPIARVVSLLEAAYATGAADAYRADKAPGTTAPIPWNAMPARAREILRYAIMYRSSWSQVASGSHVVLLDGARRVLPRGTYEEGSFMPRGARTQMGLWEVRGDEIHNLDTIAVDWAASSASALMRLGIFREYGGQDDPSAALTVLGINTIEAAIANETLRY